MLKWEINVYNTPVYPVTDAARYLRIPVATLRSWLKGLSQSKHDQQIPKPLIQRPDPALPQLSFTNLVEAHVLLICETHQVKLDKVRTALDYMSEQFDTAHPLVIKRFQTDGVDLFVDEMDRLVNVSRSGQLAMREILKHLLMRVEWNVAGIAHRFFLVIEWASSPEQDKIILLDPEIRFGRPVIAATGVPTVAIVSMVDAGDPIEAVADEFNCTLEQIKVAIQFEAQNLAA